MFALFFPGALGLSALVYEDVDNQNIAAKQGGLTQLVRLLKSQKTSLRVLVTIIRALGTLCKGEDFYIISGRFIVTSLTFFYPSFLNVL